MSDLRSKAEAAAERLLSRCHELAGISDEVGRTTRVFLSAATKVAHTKFSKWMRGAGLMVRTDAAGNLIGRREGKISKTVVIGSHLDTVPNAGKYDGILGVLAGIAVAEVLKDSAMENSLEVVAFSEEEGVRFGRPYIGSRAYAGTLDPAWLKLRDKAGVTVADAIRNFGVEPAGLETLQPRGDVMAFLEVHIEQGPVLESLALPLGIVTAIAGQTRMTLEFVGLASHAGTTPMNNRQDALVAAAGFITAVEACGSEVEGLVTTVGRIDATPNASNVIPGNVRVSLDVRHAEDAIRATAVERLLAEAHHAAFQRDVTFHVVARADFAAVPMNGEWVDRFTVAATEMGIVPKQLVSGAGHDASVMAEIAPAAMLFIRSPGGLSHNPAEGVFAEDVPVAIEMLVRAIDGI